MPILESEAATWTTGALVLITVKRNGDNFVRPAAFVWPRQDGVEWIEPSYADPWGAATTAYHERIGTWDGMTLDAGDALVELMPFDPELDAEMRGAQALLWFGDWMRRQGLGWEDERARVRALLDANKPQT